MVNVENIDLNALSVRLPRERVGVVMAHPQISLSDVEPFQWTDGKRTQQLAVIAETLRIARSNPHGEVKTHFTLLPEYSIPGLAGVDAIDSALAEQNWPSETIVIAGTDGLKQPDYAALVARANSHVHVSNAAATIPADRWLNCAIIWVKGGDGTVHRFIQPKISPARDETNVQCQMIQTGRAIFSFSGRYADNSGFFRFSTLVCFDWVSTVAGKKVWAWLLESLHNQALAQGGQNSLTWLFNIQHNPKPNHVTFLGEISTFFDHTNYASARRESCCIVFANSAGAARPGMVGSHGHSSIIFHQNPLIDEPDASFTHNKGGQRFRQSNLIYPHVDVLFRESGACIHSFGLNNPAAMVAGAAHRKKALHEPYVFPVEAAATEPRAPGNLVPAATKWFNDSLDVLPTLAKDYAARPLAQFIDPVHVKNESVLRAKDANAVRDLMKLAVVDLAKHADQWDQGELDALRHVVSTLDIFELGYATLSAAATTVHANLEIQRKAVDLVTVCGKSHDSCVKHAAQTVPKLRRHLIVVSRDRDNTSLLGYRTNILTPKRATLNTEINFTDASTARVYIGYGDILHHFLNSKNPAELEAALSASLF